MNFYQSLSKSSNHSEVLQRTVKETVQKLLSGKTTSDHPGVLLGRIQSGKTKAFIGVIAEAFDQGMDVAVVLTKNSELLGTQTTRRLKKEFKEFENDNSLNIYYTHTFGETILKKSQLLNKKIFIAIKNPSSVGKLIKVFSTNNPGLSKKKVLIIDDEADTGSVGYQGKKEEKELLETAKKLSQLRDILNDGYFLQVTATPYSLYLQPNEIIVKSGVYKPVRPLFTQILEPYPNYVGGQVYFEDSEDQESPCYNIHIQAKPEDITTLKSKKTDLRIQKNVATTDRLIVFRKSIENFIVAVAIRRAQEKKQKSENNNINILPHQLGKYATIFHVDTAKSKMVWQESLVESYLQYLQEEWSSSKKQAINRYRNHFDNDFKISLEKAKKINWINYIPNFLEVENIIDDIFSLEDYQVFVINSDQRVIDLADDDGQLKLETALNFFVGGQVLDRGITIDNLLGFFYGRDPNTSQMDTVLQHARMYGNRSKADLSVTRMYTTERIFNRMKEIYQIDETLREFLLKNPEHEVVMLQGTESGKVRPTSPNKIKLGNIYTLKSYKTSYPYGFETKGKAELTKITNKIDNYLRKLNGFTNKMRSSFKISIKNFDEIIKLIDTGMLNYNDGVSLDCVLWNTVVEKALEECNTDKIHCYVQEGRDLNRYQLSGEPMDAPYTSSTDYNYAKNLINLENSPVLILLRQDGRSEKKWKDAPFYWPVLVYPKFNRPLLFEWSN